MWPWLPFACVTPETPSCLEPGEPHLVVATTDLETGALAAISLDGGCVEDRLATLSGDPLVRSLGDRVVAADRTGGDAIRVFEAGAYGAPLAEFSVGRAVNVHDVARDGDRLVVAPYDTDALVVTGLDGAELGRLPLGSLADADGIPEVDRLVWLDGVLHASLQLLDRSDGSYRPTGPGLLVPLDLDGLDAGAPVALGPNPRVLADPLDPGAVTVATGRFYVPDGEVGTFDGAWHPLTDESTLGFDATHVLRVGERVIVVGVDLDVGGPSHVACIAADGTVAHATDPGFLVDAVTDGERVWLADRVSWNGGGAGAVLTLDPAGCALSVLTDATSLDPYGLALVATDPGTGG
ncbi:MAG: hypothetical protein H6738_11630 [Alphaproteobacteria bacterium]|nr:hypothetical protein [Alphaproteobacteria bacterium]MCB9697422.1 hypothetical protein [Alphaproteobacteria bacterium]